jgi:hypothetical protein
MNKQLLDSDYDAIETRFKRLDARRVFPRKEPEYFYKLEACTLRGERDAVESLVEELNNIGMIAYAKELDAYIHDKDVFTATKYRDATEALIESMCSALMDTEPQWLRDYVAERAMNMADGEVEEWGCEVQLGALWAQIRDDAAVACKVRELILERGEGK